MRPIEKIADRARVRFQASQTVLALPEEIFPLLCPVREFDWIPSWDCELIYTESGIAEEGCIFLTDRPDDGGVDTWVVSRFEPRERISFVRTNPLRVIRYDVTLEGGDGATTLHWHQEITSLSEAGDRYVLELDEGDFVGYVGIMERMMEHYLATGEALHVEH